MARYNDVWAFLAKVVTCERCGQLNRVYTDDPGLSPICGSCRSLIDLGRSNVSRPEENRIRKDERGLPLPPRPIRWWRPAWAELNKLLTDGRFRTSAERVAERDRFRAAYQIYTDRCNSIKAEREAQERLLREEKERLAAEGERQARLLRDEEERNERITRERQQELERLRREEEQSARAREAEAFRNSQVGRLSARLSTLQYLTGREFELFLKEVFECAGYSVEVTPESCDNGVDLIVMGRSRRLAVQAKNYSGPAGISAIQEVFLGAQLYGCDDGVVIARSGFTSAAKNAAKQSKIHLWTADEVGRFLRQGKWFEL